MRHKNQTNNYGSARPRKPSVVPLTPREQRRLASEGLDADLAALSGVQAARPMRPPHRHAFEGGRCRVCEMPEVEST